jgi:hypothetical protein
VNEEAGNLEMNKLIWILFHILAVIAIIGGIYRATGADSDALTSSLMSQYILWAILFEILALNFKD